MVVENNVSGEKKRESEGKPKFSEVDWQKEREGRFLDVGQACRLRSGPNLEGWRAKGKVGDAAGRASCRGWRAGGGLSRPSPRAMLLGSRRSSGFSNCPPKLLKCPRHLRVLTPTLRRVFSTKQQSSESPEVLKTHSYCHQLSGCRGWGAVRPQLRQGSLCRGARGPADEGEGLSGLHRGSWERWKAEVVEQLTFKTDLRCCLSCKKPLTRRLMFSFLLPLIRAGNSGKS